MIIRVYKTDFAPDPKTVRFGCDDETYFDVFGELEHVLYFYPASAPNEFLVCIDAIGRNGKIGTLLVLDLKKKGNQDLLHRALVHDFGFKQGEYEIVQA